MTKKKLNKLFLVCMSFLLLFTLGFTNVFAEEDIQYHVAFSTDNYQVKNSNKMTGFDTDSDGVFDYYMLENKAITGSTEFYVISSSEEKYFGSDGANMKVADTDSYKYNIYFNPTKNYDANEVNGTELAETNCHITYDYYIPGKFAMDLDGTPVSDFKYNHYITRYDAYIVPELEVEAGNVITVTDLVSGTIYSKTVENKGTYRIVFTPTVTRSMDEYRFDSEGNYGTGDEYTENFYITDVEYYYISFTDSNVVLADSAKVSFTFDEKTITGYRLIKDETNPQSNIYKSDRLFNPEKDNDISFVIYHYSYIFKKYEIIDDDNDKDTDVSEKTINSVAWYTTSFAYAEGRYTTTLTRDDTDFGGYYILDEFNNYGFKPDGSLNLDDAHKLNEVVETSSYYDEDNKQYLISGYVINKEMLDDDDEDYVFIISNGKKYTTEIIIKTPGTYDILYSNETTYNGSSYKYIRTQNSEGIYTCINVNSVNDFLELIDKWNLDSESSKYVIYDITADLDFAGINVTPISIFNGIIRGNGHTFSNISIMDENGNEEIALFQLVTKYGKISDLKITNLNIEAEDSSYVGLIAKNYGWLESITVDGNVKGKEYVGGIVGYNGNYSTDSDTTTDSSIKYGYGMIKNSSSSCVVKGNIIVGGLTGFNGGKILSSINEGEINHVSYSSSVTIMNIGGLAGYSTGEIVDSANNGLVGYNKIGSNVGGIVGLCNGEIYFTHNNAQVFGKDSVGGLIGYYGTVSSDNSTTSTVPDYSTILGGNKEDEAAFTEEKDISSHNVYYSYSISEIHGTRYIGGLLGYTNSTTLNIANTFVKGKIYADSGSYAGGLVGYLGGGKITSSGFIGYVEANGTVNKYVGGITGYSNGSIYGTSANASLAGNEYVGGIAGYCSKDAKTISNYANVYMITKSTASHIGCICGYVDSIDEASGTFLDSTQYNFFLGSDLSDYSGINGVHYGKASHYAAARITYASLENKDLLSQVSTRFGKIDDDTNYFTTGEKLPFIKNFTECDELDDDSFDDDTDCYESYLSYFGNVSEVYANYQKELAKLIVRIVFKEWDNELKDNENDNYIVNSIVELPYGSDFNNIELPKFIYADERNMSKRDNDALYLVSWDSLAKEFKNQTIYAKYVEVFTSISNKELGVFVEGEFTQSQKVEITKDDTGYHIIITENDMVKEYTNLIIKVKVSSTKKCYITVNGNKVDSIVYGDYLVFTLASTNNAFDVEEGPFTFSMLPDYAYALMVVIPLLILFVVAIVISNVKSSKPKKETNEDESNNESEENVENTIEESDSEVENE